MMSCLSIYSATRFRRSLDKQPNLGKEDLGGPNIGDKNVDNYRLPSGQDLRLTISPVGTRFATKLYRQFSYLFRLCLCSLLNTDLTVQNFERNFEKYLFRNYKMSNKVNIFSAHIG